MFKAELIELFGATLRQALNESRVKNGDTIYFCDGFDKNKGNGLYKVVFRSDNKLVYIIEDEVMTLELDSICKYSVQVFDESSMPIPVYRAIYKNDRNQVVVSQRLFPDTDAAKLALKLKFLQLDPTPVYLPRKFLAEAS